MNDMNGMKNMNIFCICGPSGSGKTTIIKNLLDLYPTSFQLYPTIVDRPQRESEKSASFSTYKFISETEFDLMIQNNDFYEYEKQSHNNHRYGKAKSIFNTLDPNKNILTEMRITNIDQFKSNLSKYPVSSFYLILQNEEHLKRRLLERGDSNEIIENRIHSVKEEEERDMEKADFEINSWDGELEKTIEELVNIFKVNFHIEL